MRETHRTRLLAYLKRYKSITSLEAIRDSGNTRLSATIHILRSENRNIISSDIKVPTRWGTTTTVTKYIYNENK